MAWLQNLAGRAEDLLNKVDKHAATVLNEPNAKSLDDEISLSQSSFSENHQTPEEVSYVINENKDKQDGSATPDSVYTEEIDDISTIINNDQIMEKPPKTDSPMTQSMSSHCSFNISEELQTVNEKATRLELENQELNKQILNFQHIYAQLRNENASLQSQVDTANYLVNSAQSEMEQYKARTQRILHEKESLITLKTGNLDEKNDNLISSYNEELKREVEFQQAKNGELAAKLLQLTQEVSHLQQQLLKAQHAAQEAAASYQEHLAKERRVRSIAEEECRAQADDLQAKTHRLSQQCHIIENKNMEISFLQNAIKENKSNAFGNEDLDNRIKSLTDTLMLKQNSLETVTTERNALRLQLEKIENEYHKNQVELQRAQVRVINVNDTDDVKSQVPQFLRISPFDAGVTRRVKHAYSSLDAISVRTGRFLRRYPVARVCVFCYMVMLQFWVLVVLVMYVPNSR